MWRLSLHKYTRGKTGRGRKEWKYVEVMDQALGHKPAICLPVVIESWRACGLDPSPASPT